VLWHQLTREGRVVPVSRREAWSGCGVGVWRESMGCTSSKSAGYSKDAVALRDRIVEMLKLKQMELKGSEKQVTFSKILMKTSTLNKTYRRITTVYRSLDSNGDGHLDDGELQLMVDRLGISDDVTATDLKGVIELCDIDGDRNISLKEFVVTLSLLYLLKAVPSLLTRRSPFKSVIGKRIPPAEELLKASDGEASPIERAASPTDQNGNPVFLGCSDDIHYLVHWVVAAYLLFDVECTGHIDQATVKNLQRTASTEDGSDLFLNDDRWKELDWDKNGKVSFEEFVFAFSEWIKDFHHDDDDE